MLRQYDGEITATYIVARGGRGVHRIKDIFWASSLNTSTSRSKMKVDMKVVNRPTEGGVPPFFHFPSPGLSRSLARVTLDLSAQRRKFSNPYIIVLAERRLPFHCGVVSQNMQTAR